MKAKRPGYLTQYAKHAGITKTAAAEQLKRVGIDYMQAFDFAEADRRRQAARHADRMPFSKPIYADQASSNTTDGDEDKPNNVGAAASPVYSEHQAKRELYRAELTRLEFEERIGSLIPVEDVAAEWFRLTRIVKDAVMNVPSRLAGVLASISDERKVHDILEAELRQALEALTTEKRQAA